MSSNWRTVNRSGFSLIELSLVLVILAVMITGALTVGKAQLEASRVTQTKEKLESIDRALMIYRKMYNRLPCPADATLALNNVNFGVAAANPNGYCTTGSPAANLIYGLDPSMPVAAGTVPVRTLSLPDDFMFDGWGRRLSYKIDTRVASVNAYENYPPNDGTLGVITIHRKATVTIKSTYYPHGAILLVASHGPNGHGAIPRAGGASHINAGSTNTWELGNCSCSSTGNYLAANTTWGASVEPYTDLATPTNSYDDITMYRMISDYRLENETPDPYRGAELASTDNFSVNQARFWTLNRAFDSFMGVSNFVTGTVAGTPNAIAFTPENTFIGVAHATSPYVSFYKQLGDFIELQPAGMISAAPAGTGYGIAFADNELHMAVAHAGGTFVSVYRRSGNVFNMLPGTSISANPTGTGAAVAFSPGSGYLAVAHATSPYLTVYKRSEDDFAKVTTGAGGGGSQCCDIIPAGNATGVSFSANGTYLAVSHATSPFLTVYKINSVTNTLTKVITGAGSQCCNTLPPSTANAVAFSPDNNYLAVAHNNSPYITVYILGAGDIFNKDVAAAGSQFSATLPAASTISIAFSHDSQYLAAGVSGAGGYRLSRYKVDTGDVFNSLPAGTVNDGSIQGTNGVAFRH